MKKICLNAKGSLNILQVSDPQDMHFVRKTMLLMLSAAYDKLKPDLVVFSGDNILGNHLCDRRFGSGRKNLTEEQEYANMKKALNYILEPLEKRNIPFTMIFGNHDDMNQITKEKQLDIFRTYSCFVSGDGEITGNNVLPIYDNSGENLVYSVWLFDSARYRKEEDICEQSVLPETVNWFKSRSAKLNELNGGTAVPSIAFIHIPLPSVKKALKADSSGVSDSDGKKYIIDRTKGSGILNEYPSFLKDDNGLYDALKHNGAVKAIVFGHDHPNNFKVNIDNIDIIQTSCASFRCYGNKKLRGVRLFEIEPDSVKTFNTRFYSYEDLCSDGLISSLRYFCDADEYEKKKAAAFAVSAIALALSSVSALIKICNKKT